MKLATHRLAQAAGKLSLVSLAIMTGGMTMADAPGWYLGANVGASTAKIDDARITSNLLGSGFSSVTIADQDRDTGYKIFGGYQLNRNFSVEGGLFDLGSFGFRASTVPAGTLNGNIRVRGVSLDLIGTLPVSDRFSVFGRVGANYAETRDDFSGTGAVGVYNPNPSAREVNPKIGLGLQYAFSDAWAMRAEVERYRINDAVGNKGDIDLVSVGMVYRFGGKTPKPVAAAPATFYRPVEVASPPPPLPVAQSQPLPPPPLQSAPPPVPRKVTFSADSLFDFDKAVVLPAGKQNLDAFANGLRGVSYDKVGVTGHTDRIGSHAYNLKLSTRRAEAVRGYLIDSGGIPASKITAQGVNGSNPVTKPEDCTDKMKRPALITCLQPDRRVEIQVTGSR